MENPYLTKEAIILNKKKEADDVYLFTLKFKDGHILKFNPGQFVLAGIPGFGESALDVCSAPNSQNTFQLCIRNVGVNTLKITSLNKGDSIWIRGPYGNGFPVEKLSATSPQRGVGGSAREQCETSGKNLLLIGGGTGIIVIRGLIQHFLGEQKNRKTEKPKNNLQIFYGAKDWKSMLFRDEFNDWKKIASLHLILEEPSEKPACPRGLITKLFEITKIIEKPSVIMAGPPIMYKFCLQEVQKRLSIPNNEIYLSLERRMHCGVGVCQHCAIGQKYVCKDGPVFTYEELKNIKGAL